MPRRCRHQPAPTLPTAGCRAWQEDTPHCAAVWSHPARSPARPPSMFPPPLGRPRTQHAHLYARPPQVAPTDIEEGMRVGVDRQKYQIQIPLPPKIDASVTMMTVEEKPDVTYSDIGGCKEQVPPRRRPEAQRACGLPGPRDRRPDPPAASWGHAHRLCVSFQAATATAPSA